MDPQNLPTIESAASDSAEHASEDTAIPVGLKCTLCPEHYQRGGLISDSGELDFERRPVHGWPALAQLMANTPDFATFARFRDLNVKSLLYYQAELTSLRAQLHHTEWKDHLFGNFPHHDELTANVEFLVNTDSLFMSSKRPGRQIRLVRRIRGVLKEYSKSP